jgi:peptide/nickel transport system permease protein
MTSTARPMERFARVLRMFAENPAAALAAAMLVFFLAAAIAGPMIISRDPDAVDLGSLKEPPSALHWFGTDNKGRDVFSRVVSGARVSLAAGFASALLTAAIGVLFGLIAGFVGGKTDAILSQMFTVFLAFPSLLLAVGISAVMQPGLASSLLAITLVSWAGFARLVRGMTLTLKERTFIEATRALGASTPRILFRHLLPNALPLIAVAASMRVGSFILLESALSFLGLGVQPPTPTWGSMISLNRAFINSAPWMVVFPGLAISATVISCNVLGDFLRDRLDPEDA